MQDQSQEIYVIILVGGVLALLLVGFIVTILFLYQRKQHRQEQEIVRIKKEYDQELLTTQLEIQEETFKTIGQELHDNIGQVSSIIRNHHEHFDGNGYPDGLQGEAIPYLSRIISVCDSYDAMTTTRVYSRARSHDETLKSCRRKWDRRVIRMCSGISLRR